MHPQQAVVYPPLVAQLEKASVELHHHMKYKSSKTLPVSQG